MDGIGHCLVATSRRVRQTRTVQYTKYRVIDTEVRLEEVGL